MPLISVLDTYYSQIVAQMAAVGAKITVPINGTPMQINQPFGGIVEAQDWPQIPAINSVTPEGTLYLLRVNTVEVLRGDLSSEANKLFEFQCQWTWILMGTDVQSTQQAMNRGDRYRTNVQITENLRQAHYPGFVRQQDYVSDSQGNVTSKFSATPYPVSPIEMVRWSALRFMPKVDITQSGLIYGAAHVSVYGYSDVSTAIA